MKQELQNLLRQAVIALKQEGILDESVDPSIQIDRSRNREHGDFASNLALILAKSAGQPPRELAQLILQSLPHSSLLKKAEIAGPGFINFFVDASAQFAVIPDILEKKEQFGRSQIGAGEKVQIEFVSANPTGPLHVGHGRGAAYGSAVANLLEASGFEVEREYYINDAGRQMDILATSIWLRYLEQCGEEIPFPSNAYRGEYIREIARIVQERSGRIYHQNASSVISDLPADEPDGGDKEEFIDAVIERSKSLLGQEAFRAILDHGLDYIVDDIRNDLEEFRVPYDRWFSERQLITGQAVDAVLNKLRGAGHLYEKDGAIWFACGRLNDEKDRVVVRENGQITYLASDIAYHLNKIERGFDRLIDIWGADHHGYVPRIRAAIDALGHDHARLKVLLVQFATLYRGKTKLSMSTRSGEFVTLRQLREEVGTDAARFFYLMRRCEQHLDFDLDLARSQSNDNPVYYVQYAHARVSSVFRQLQERDLHYDPKWGTPHLEMLQETHEKALITTLSRYPEVVQKAALNHEPHLVIQYLRDLANDFHTYYNAHQFLVADTDLRDARLNLIKAVQHVIANALKLMGISAPESM